jgi:hypothetical protein
MSQENAHQPMTSHKSNIISMNKVKEANHSLEHHLQPDIKFDQESELSLDQEMVEGLLQSFIRDTPESPEWRSQTAFTVAFNGSFEVTLQTRQTKGFTAQRLTLRNLKTTANEQLFHQLQAAKLDLTNLTETELQQWILERLQTNLQLESLVMTSPVIETPIALDITALKIVQPSHPAQPLIASKANPLFPDSILGDRSFDLEVTIALPETAIAELQQQLIVLTATCEARHLTTGTVTQWGEAQMSVRGGTRSHFTLILQDVTVAELGAYRLRVFANVQNLPATEALFKVPVLEVESPHPASCAI